MPKLITVAGPPGAGKTTICTLVRNEIDITWPKVDAIKLMITDRASTVERRDLAHRVFNYFVALLMQEEKDILLELPITYPHANHVREEAQKRGYDMTEVMLLPPLEVCMTRHNQRYQPERKYTIPEERVRDLYATAQHQTTHNTLTIDTSQCTAEEATRHILKLAGYHPFNKEHGKEKK